MTGANLTHILKLIFLGPQPRDELYEEWSKDPLAEWFREQRKGTSWASRRKAFQESFFWFCWAILPQVLLIGSYFLFREFMLHVFAIVSLTYAILFFARGKRTTHRTIPTGGVMALLLPVIMVAPLTELWLSGLKGREILKSMYVERMSSINALIYTGVACVTLAAVVGGLAQQAIVSYGLFAICMVWLPMQIARFGMITSRNPFASHERCAGLRSFRDYVFTKEEVPGRIVPIGPVIGLGVIFTMTVCLVIAQLLPPRTLIIAILLPIASAVGYIHWYGRKMPDYDREMLEEAFRNADRDFDQWVRRELIGDEDA